MYPNGGGDIGLSPQNTFTRFLNKFKIQFCTIHSLIRFCLGGGDFLFNNLDLYFVMSNNSFFVYSLISIYENLLIYIVRHYILNVPTHYFAVCVISMNSQPYWGDNSFHLILPPLIWERLTGVLSLASSNCFVGGGAHTHTHFFFLSSLSSCVNWIILSFVFFRDFLSSGTKVIC